MRHLAALLLVACGARATPVADPTPMPVKSTVQMSWGMNVTEDEHGDPTTHLTLDFNGENAPGSQDVAEVPGVCSYEEAASERIASQLRCWWAGQGQIFQLVREPGTVTVLMADIDEEMKGEPRFEPHLTVQLKPGVTTELVVPPDATEAP
jgi:hypothetical protein